MVKRKSMLFYYDWREILIDSFCGDYNTIGRIILALLDYAESGELPVNLNDDEMIAFNFMYTQVDRDNTKYVERVERNRRSAALSNARRKAAEEALDD